MEIIASEDFKLTDAIREEIHQRVEFINEHVSEPLTVKVYLSKDSGHTYHVKFLTHVFRQEVVSDAKDSDFHVCLNSAKSKILRRIQDIKNKKIGKRH